MTGVAGFTYEMIDAWARLTDRHPEPHEVRALFYLDVTSRHPGKNKMDKLYEEEGDE